MAGDDACPVLAAWANMPELIASVAKSGRMVDCTAQLTRQTCVDNADILEPLINVVGSLAASRGVVDKCQTGAAIISSGCKANNENKTMLQLSSRMFADALSC